MANKPTLSLSALQKLVSSIEADTCLHEETHRGGSIWEICDQCGEMWSDDKNPKPEFSWPDGYEDVVNFLANHPQDPKTDTEIEVRVPVKTVNAAEITSLQSVIEWAEGIEKRQGSHAQGIKKEVLMADAIIEAIEWGRSKSRIQRIEDLQTERREVEIELQSVRAQAWAEKQKVLSKAINWVQYEWFTRDFPDSSTVHLFNLFNEYSMALKPKSSKNDEWVDSRERTPGEGDADPMGTVFFVPNADSKPQLVYWADCPEYGFWKKTLLLMPESPKFNI